MNEPLPYSFRELTIYFSRLGTVGFGDSVALVDYIHRDLVEHRRWISEEYYQQCLAQLAPGPLAAYLAIYLGYVHHWILGASVSAKVFNGCVLANAPVRLGTRRG